jgi:hypothetical protein
MCEIVNMDFVPTANSIFYDFVVKEHQHFEKNMVAWLTRRKRLTKIICERIEAIREQRMPITLLLEVRRS